MLRAELTRELGVEWTGIRDGIAEVAGVPEAVIQTFSRRRAEIEASMADRGTVGPCAAEAAALATRRAKDHAVDAEELVGEWRERAAKLSFDDKAIVELVNRASVRTLDGELVADIASEVFGSAGLTAHESSFSRRDVIEALCARLPAGVVADGRTLEQLADRLLTDARVVAITHADPEDVGGRFIRRDGRPMPISLRDRRFSTAEFLAIEQHFVDRAVDGIGAELGVARDEHLQRSL